MEETSGEPDEGGPDNYKGGGNHQSKKVKLTEAQESIITEKLYSAAPSLRRGRHSGWPHMFYLEDFYALPDAPFKGFVFRPGLEPGIFC